MVYREGDADEEEGDSSIGHMSSVIAHRIACLRSQGVATAAIVIVALSSSSSSSSPPSKMEPNRIDSMDPKIDSEDSISMDYSSSSSSSSLSSSSSSIIQLAKHLKDHVDLIIAVGEEDEVMRLCPDKLFIDPRSAPIIAIDPISISPVSASQLSVISLHRLDSHDMTTVSVERMMIPLHASSSPSSSDEGNSSPPSSPLGSSISKPRLWEHDTMYIEDIAIIIKSSSSNRSNSSIRVEFYIHHPHGDLDPLYSELEDLYLTLFTSHTVVIPTIQVLSEQRLYFVHAELPSSGRYSIFLFRPWTHWPNETECLGLNYHRPMDYKQILSDAIVIEDDGDTKVEDMDGRSIDSSDKGNL